MIRGRVERNVDGGLEPWLTISVQDSGGAMHYIDVILDTGFTGWLMLPVPLINELGLTRQGDRRSILATGEANRLDFYVTTVLWHGQPRRVEVLQSLDQFLLGTELLEGSRVTVDAWEGGDVIIEEVQSAAPT